MYILITGGFDPVHSGHIQALKTAADIGAVCVGLNSDEYISRKRGKTLLPFVERYEIMRSIRYVSHMLPTWNDQDGSSVEAIKLFHKYFSDTGKPLAFANGGDRTPSGVNEREFITCEQLGVIMLFGLGGPKTASSSTFLHQYENQHQKTS